jgi:Na+/H+ antiporter NhaC
MLTSSIVLQASPEIVAPWELPVQYWVMVLALEILMIVLVFLWARSGRDKHEKDVPFDRSAESFGSIIQSGFGAVPIFLIVLWLSVLLWITGYIVISIITGVQY